MRKRLTRRDVRALVRRRVARAGSMRAAAAQLAVDRSAVEDVLAGHRPSPALLEALGLERVPEYRRRRHG